MTLEITDSSISSLEAEETTPLAAFPTEFASKLSGIARCLGDGNNRPYAIRSGEPYEINFNEPAYVSTVEIEFSKATVGANIHLSIHDTLNNRIVRKRCDEDSLDAKVSFQVRCVCSGLSLFLPSGYYELFRKRSLQINRIRILGYVAEDFENLSNLLTRLQGFRENAISELSKERAAVTTLKAQVLEREEIVAKLEATKTKELAALEEEVDEAKVAVRDTAVELDAVKAALASDLARRQSILDQIGEKGATVRDIEGEIAQGKEQLRSLAEAKSEAERRLRDLTSNVNLFSEEFSSFSNHGAKQATTFIWLSVVPLAIIAMLTGQLLLGAVDLSVKYVKEPNLDLMTVFVTRLPYLAVCFSILTVCYTVLRFLFNRISTIFAERLDFAKIGIVAKDVASASASGLVLSDKDLYEARTYLKIEMLKSYLSGNIGVFTYAKRPAEHEKTLGATHEAPIVTKPTPATADSDADD